MKSKLNCNKTGFCNKDNDKCIYVYNNECRYESMTTTQQEKSCFKCVKLKEIISDNNLNCLKCLNKCFKYFEENPIIQKDFKNFSR